VWPWGSLDTPPRGLSHATPLGGCCVTVHDPSPAHAGGSCLPFQGGFPHSTTLISRQLLPDDTQLQPLGELASMWATKNIAMQEQHMKLLLGTKVPIR